MVRPGEKAAPYGEKSIMSTSDNQQASPAPHGQPDLVAVAEEVIAQAAAGDFDSAVRPFAGAMREQFPADKLAQLWVSLTAQAGAFQGIQGSKQARLLQYETVVTVAAFERGHITFQTIFDDQGHV